MVCEGGAVFCSEVDGAAHRSSSLGTLGWEMSECHVVHLCLGEAIHLVH